MRELGRDWPAEGLTMIGMQRLKSLQDCVETVLEQDVPGDLVECGVWRGGASIFMRAVLEVHGNSDKTVWLADSFQGLPPPDTENFPMDRQVRLDRLSSVLGVSEEQVRANFEKYGLLDTHRVRFLKGWFKDTLPTAPIDQIAVLRLDGDLYESTIQTLDALYPRLSPGGFCIIDDYGMDVCRQAVTDYREKHGIVAKIVSIDGSAVLWRRTSSGRFMGAE